MSNSSLYDPDTHYYLGQHLRFLRDYNGIDLMPFYNCYSGIQSDKIRLTNQLISNNKDDDNLTTYICYIKYNQDYTIYTNCNVPFKIMPAYYSDAHIVSTDGDFTITNVGSCYKSNPYKYRLNIDTSKFINSENATNRFIEDYLVLLIQLPKNINDLIVLEGDYTNVKTSLNNELPTIFISESYIDENHVIKTITNDDLNNILKPIPKLLKTLGNKTYAFSDEILEYLLLNTITKDEYIKENILRIQNNIKQIENENFETIPKYLKNKDI